MMNRVSHAIVVNAYDFVGLVMNACGMTDLTEGRYNDNQITSYEKAQHQQVEYLLDEMQCQNGSKICDVGCGEGRILLNAQARGVTAVGISISPSLSYFLLQS